MKTAKQSAKKTGRVLGMIVKFSRKSAEVLRKFRKGLAGIWRQEGEKSAERVFGSGFKIIQTEGLISERKRDREEAEEGMKEGLFRRARPPPRRRGKEQLKSEAVITV